MPVIVPKNFPALEALSEQDMFLMNVERAMHQDIRALKILILNLMPLKIITETQLLRLISNSLVQVEVTFIHPGTHESKNTDGNHLKTFYKTFEEIKNQKFDGMIVTGAPIEKLDFEEVTYWEELKTIMDYSEDNVTSSLFICWGAQAGLYHFYGVPKHPLKEKKFGVFQHKTLSKHCQLLRGYDDLFNAPHSRHTETRREDIEKVPELEILAESDEAGLYIISNKDRTKNFITGHSEYDDLTLHSEYMRDKEKGLGTKLPLNYYPDDNPENKPPNTWRGHSNILFSNWLNYCVYQMTEYELDK